jgi:hypothetical protein
MHLQIRRFSVSTINFDRKTEKEWKFHAIISHYDASRCTMSQHKSQQLEKLKEKFLPSRFSIIVVRFECTYCVASSMDVVCALLFHQWQWETTEINQKLRGTKLLYQCIHRQNCFCLSNFNWFCVHHADFSFYLATTERVSTNYSAFSSFSSSFVLPAAFLVNEQRREGSNVPAVFSHPPT